MRSMSPDSVKEGAEVSHITRDGFGETGSFTGQWFRWPISRESNSFRIFVIEPREYRPPDHSRIFKTAFDRLINPKIAQLEHLDDEPPRADIEQFDLVTFPEAFLPARDLVETLKSVETLTSIGCVHVGLRPDTTDRHLFTVRELKQLTADIRQIGRVHGLDVEAFESWLQRQAGDPRFNVGCLFTIDKEMRLRVCLHPKLVASKFESSPLHEQNMTEADVLTLITLSPDDSALLTVTLQPLLCSDALELPTSRPGNRPLDR